VLSGSSCYNKIHRVLVNSVNSKFGVLSSLIIFVFCTSSCLYAVGPILKLDLTDICDLSLSVWLPCFLCSLLKIYINLAHYSAMRPASVHLRFIITHQHSKDMQKPILLMGRESFIKGWHRLFMVAGGHIH